MTIRTNDDERTVGVLNGIGIAAVAPDHEGGLRVNEQMGNTAAMARAIVNAGIDLREICLRTVSLEDYYLGVTGGMHNG